MLSHSATSARILQRLATTSLKSRVLVASIPRPTNVTTLHKNSFNLSRSFITSRPSFNQDPLSATSTPTSSEEAVKSESSSVPDPLSPSSSPSAPSSEPNESSSSPVPEIDSAESPTLAPSPLTSDAYAEGSQPTADAIPPSIAGEPMVDTPSLEVFVGGLSWNVDNDWLESEILKALDVSEGIESVRIARNQNGRSKGFAFIAFTNAELAERASKLEIPIDNKVVTFRVAEQRTVAPNTARGNPPTPRPKNGPTNTLWVGNLAYSVDEATLGETFEEYGTVVRVSIPMDRETGYARGIGYVEFESVEGAKKALEEVEKEGGISLGGRRARLDFSESQGRKPYGGAGGRGQGRGQGSQRGGRGGGERRERR